MFSLLIDFFSEVINKPAIFRAKNIISDVDSDPENEKFLKTFLFF